MSMIEIVPRRPALAAAMSILLPGFGQLYNGQLNKGIFLFLAFALIAIPFTAFVALILPAAWMLPVLLLSLAAALGLYGFGIWDAWRVARHSGDYRLRQWQQPALYVALLLFAYLSVLASSADYMRAHLVESFRIPSDSMSPNVLRGDILFADKRVNCPGCKHGVGRGDIAIFVYPNDRTLYYIKRVIALPGDEVRIAGREVFVNGRSIRGSSEGESVTEHGDGGEYRVLWPEGEVPSLQLKVPQGRVFVLGDDRRATKDSRLFGTVPLVDVVGKARQVWFSYDAGRGIRWQRLGQVL